METLGLKLSEYEQRLFGELFSCCDVENQGRISGTKASELFIASQLPTETLHQISELCGAKRLGHFGRSQFYIALKLIAAAQAGLPLVSETFTSGKDIPLPKFTKTNEVSSSVAPSEGRPSNFNQQHPGQLPPPPTKVYSRQGSGVIHRQGSVRCDAVDSSHVAVSQSQGVAVPVAATGNSGNSSPAETPTTPKAAQHGDKNWTAFHHGLHQDSHLNWANFEEHHQLLGTEEDSSERHSSDDEVDVWTITSEQREYYTTQFQCMQTDVKGKISGAVAKEFFEKSKLPVHELSKIWQLSDIDKDGALTLEEFCTAMHLVVLRRNNIDLPETLPSSLIPRISKKPAEDGQTFPPSQQQPQPVPQAQTATSPTKVQTPTEPLSPQSKEWTKFNDSPTSSVSSPVMKPVNFDFSAASVEQDPKILHPVALRLSPDGQPIPYSSDQEKQSNHLESGDAKTTLSTAQVIHRPTPRKTSGQGSGVIPPPPKPTVTQSTSGDMPATAASDITGQPSTTSSFSGTTSQGTSQGPPLLPQGPKKEPPPPPPPRPRSNHARSSSLDLNKFGKTMPHFLGVPPAVPPRASPSTAAPRKVGSQDDNHTNFVDNEEFADFSHFVETRTEVTTHVNHVSVKSGAFEVYKKTSESPTGDIVSSASGEIVSSPLAPTDDTMALLVDINQSDAIAERKPHPSAPLLALSATEIKSVPRDKRDLQLALRALRERNMLLSRLNSELNQELSEVMEERIALEIQLEHMKPFSY
ncbi:RALBP1 associated Eps domain containing isoform X2 [Tachypleus tridentatus]|uniref:RALBP1 associated Eps domain containing isoform X2 n=1 Tax=Tachypleus tridentatus TaxID=6853 RepID=UPI003FD24A68